MDDVRNSKRLSWLLRHGTVEAGLNMDAAGWVPVDEVLAYLRISRPRLEELVATNSKRRLQLTATHVRACQGHSLEGMPVTLDALEASWEAYRGDASVWHATTVDAALAIAREGIHAAARTHVHLAPALDSTVGKRANTPLALEIGAARMRAHGIGLFVAPNGVILARSVPASAIIGIVPISRAVKRARRSCVPPLG